MDKFDFTSASRRELALVWKAIADEMGDDRFFTTKELDHLPRVLDKGEQVLAFSSGLHKGTTWLIVLTDERILFLDKGMIFGVKTSSIELERINNFDYEKGIFFGSISIGSNAEIYEITNVWKKTVEPFTKKLRQAMKARQDGEQLYSPGTSMGDSWSRRIDKEAEVDNDNRLSPAIAEQKEFPREAPKEPNVRDHESSIDAASRERMRKAGLS